MEKRFSTSNTPLVIGVVRERTVQNALSKIREYEASGATAIDVHLSCLDDEYKTVASLKLIADGTDLPILALNYNQRHNWTEIGDSEEDRVALMLKGLEAGMSAMDMQGYTFDPASKRNYVGEDMLRKADYSQ